MKVALLGDLVNQPSIQWLTSVSGFLNNLLLLGRRRISLERLIAPRWSRARKMRAPSAFSLLE